jgi:hypothetical protein
MEETHEIIAMKMNEEVGKIHSQTANKLMKIQKFVIPTQKYFSWSINMYVTRYKTNN